MVQMTNAENSIGKIPEKTVVIDLCFVI